MKKKTSLEGHASGSREALADQLFDRIVSCFIPGTQEVDRNRLFELMPGARDDPRGIPFQLDRIKANIRAEHPIFDLLDDGALTALSALIQRGRLEATYVGDTVYVKPPLLTASTDAKPDAAVKIDVICKRYDVSKPQARAMIKSGDIPYRKVPKRNLYEPLPKKK